MRIWWLGWAGVEVEEQDERVVVDPLGDPAAVFAAFGERAAGVALPEVIPPTPGAVAGLVTHLHRDHADAAALSAALPTGGTVHEPYGHGGTGIEQLAIAQADHELTATSLTRRPTAPWTSLTAGPFTLTALPAVDGTGDPQVSWLIEAGGKRVLHLGDTMFHGWWWLTRLRYGPLDVAFLPVNGPVADLPHRQPPSELAVAMDPRQAAEAAALLQVGLAVPMHYDSIHQPPIYTQVDRPAETFVEAASRRGVKAQIVASGEHVAL